MTPNNYKYSAISLVVTAVMCFFQHFLAYGPSYQLAVTPGIQPDMNSKEHLRNQLNKAWGKWRQ